jgi:hypothetical protein
MTKLIFILSLLAISSFATWSDPVLLPSPINDYDCFCPRQFPTGNFLIYGGWRPGAIGDCDIWLSHKQNGIWQTPTNMGSNVNAPSCYTGTSYLTQNATKLYFSQMIGWAEDIYVSNLSGTTPAPKVLVGSPISVSGFDDSHPVLSEDGSQMYFGSTRASGLGNLDIYYSTLSGGNWSQPVNLGGEINSTGNDSPSWVSPDGLTLVFSSERNGSLGNDDLWVTTKSGSTWSIPVNFGSPINSTGYEGNAEFHCNEGAVGGFMYLSRMVSLAQGGRIYTSVDSNYINVSPASVGELKALYR